MKERLSCLSARTPSARREPPPLRVAPPEGLPLLLLPLLPPSMAPTGRRHRCERLRVEEQVSCCLNVSSRRPLFCLLVPLVLALAAPYRGRCWHLLPPPPLLPSSPNVPDRHPSPGETSSNRTTEAPAVLRCSLPWNCGLVPPKRSRFIKQPLPAQILLPTSVIPSSAFHFFTLPPILRTSRNQALS